LETLPLRAATVRDVLHSLPEEPQDHAELVPDAADYARLGNLDPGWVLSRLVPGSPSNPLNLIAERPWWPRGAETEGLNRLWRHAVAVSLTVRRLAREVGMVDSERIERIGLLHGLPLWAVSAVDPGWLTAWLEEPDPRRRREHELRTLGTELTTFGRELAERWGCDPLVADAAWLHADMGLGLEQTSADPRALELLQEAFTWAERTPWAIRPAAARDLASPDRRLRVLVAEVQVLCASSFIDSDATPHEERLARSNARLRIQVARWKTEAAASERFLDAFSAWEPTAGPAAWTERSGEAWCREPGVSAARVVWRALSAADRTAADDVPAPLPDAPRPPVRTLLLHHRGQPTADVHLWGPPAGPLEMESPRSWSAWQTWAALVADRERLARRLEAAVRLLRDTREGEELRLRQATLAAMAEFAAGAGHELNNPLAVIVGRVQLLLAQESDAASLRALRAILVQAQRAHRILRDLMYVARPAEPRPKFCQPEEIVRNCLRDLKGDAEARGVRIETEGADGSLKVWADHDGLRHVLESLVRNAFEATPKGGKIRVSTALTPQSLHWTVHDTGRGITAAEGRHLFDPFYCGRQAGRGLGLGLPRAARFVAQVGGNIRWHSAPGQGSIFQVHVPLTAPPQPRDASAAQPEPAAALPAEPA
jgi:signal transduction histidine kinase